MIRRTREPRIGWREKIADCGIGFCSSVMDFHWNESAYYEVSKREASLLYSISKDIYQLMIEATELIVQKKRLAELGFTEYEAKLLSKTWNSTEYTPTFFTRLDFVWHGDYGPILINRELTNPRLLLESSIVQKKWLGECLPGAEQFNSIERHLVELWREKSFHKRRIHFAFSLGDLGQYLNAEYLHQLAIESGIEATLLPLSDLHQLQQGEQYYDRDGRPIDVLVAVTDSQSTESVISMVQKEDSSVCICEPYWKKIWASEHWLDWVNSEYSERAISKRLFYRDSSHKHHIVYSSWIVAQEACGLGITERSWNGKSNRLEFIPHLVAA